VYDIFLRIFVCFVPVFRIYDILVCIRIRGSMPLINGSGFGSDPAIFVIDLQDVNKKLIRDKKKFFCLFLFESTFTSFFKDKKSKRSRKTVGIKVFLPFFLVGRRIRIREAQKCGSGGSRSGTLLRTHVHGSVKKLASLCRG
jgi:hypothetical protein